MLNIMQFARKLRQNNYADNTNSFFPSTLIENDKTAAILAQRKKRVLSSCTHTTRRRVHSV